MKEYKLTHGGTLCRVSNTNYITDEDILFEITIFESPNQDSSSALYVKRIIFKVEGIKRSELSLIRRYETDRTKYFRLYEDVLNVLKNRNIYRDYIIMVDCSEYYPSLIFPIS